jgi:hypothetical protein
VFHRVHWQWGDANLTKGSYKTSFNVMGGQEFNIFHTLLKKTASCYLPGMLLYTVWCIEKTDKNWVIGYRKMVI